MTIIKTDWNYRLRIARATSGHLYAHLMDSDDIKVGGIITMHRGPSFDAAINDAPSLYTELEKRRATYFGPNTTATTAAAMAPDKSQSSKPTTTKGKTKSKSAPRVRIDSGHPGIDSRLE